MKLKAFDLRSTPFNERQVQAIARAELARAPRADFTHLWFYGPKETAPLPQPDHVSYESWRRMYNLVSQSTNEIAEVISIKGNAIMRMHKADGAVVNSILAGKNPLELPVGNDQYNIVYFAFGSAGRFAAQNVDIYIKTTAALDPSIGLILLRKLEPLFPALQVSVAIRRDAWFIFQPGYPFLNPFAEDLNPPTADEYKRTQILVCGHWTGSASCTIQ